MGTFFWLQPPTINAQFLETFQGEPSPSGLI